MLCLLEQTAQCCVIGLEVIQEVNSGAEELWDAQGLGRNMRAAKEIDVHSDTRYIAG